MTKELLARINQGINEYTSNNNCTIEQFAKDFVRKNAFNPGNNAFSFVEEMGWKVIDRDFLGDIIIHEFKEYDDAMERFTELYPNASKETAEFLIYEAPIDVIPNAGATSKTYVSLSGLSDADAASEIVEAGYKLIVKTITDIRNTLKDESETGYYNSVNPPTMSEAISKRMSLQKSLEARRAEYVFELLRESSDEDYLMNEKEWKEGKMAASGEKLVYPNLKKMNVNPRPQSGITYPNLLALDRFLSTELGTTVGLVLAKVHPILAGSFGANPAVRESISGSVVQSEDVPFNFGKHLGSNLLEMIHEMAHKGFDFQPIFDSKIGGNCIGLVRLSDVANLMSNESFELRKDSTVADLENYGPEGLILPPPPQIDASVDISIAGNMLNHGIEAVIVKFDPEHWFGSNAELDLIKQTIQPGYHILTPHDIIAYRLLGLRE